MVSLTTSLCLGEVRLSKRFTLIVGRLDVLELMLELAQFAIQAEDDISIPGRAFLAQPIAGVSTGSGAHLQEMLVEAHRGLCWIPREREDRGRPGLGDTLMAVTRCGVDTAHVEWCCQEGRILCWK